MDLFLYGAMIFDLGFKTFKTNRIKKKMKKWYRYRYMSQTKKVIYIILMSINVIYILYRIYSILVLKQYEFYKVFLVLPVIQYYVLFDFSVGGIYFNNEVLYYKQNLIYFGTIIRSFRYKENDHYEYSITYREKDSGEREITMKVIDEPNAYPLLMSIPFEELT